MSKKDNNFKSVNKRIDDNYSEFSNFKNDTESRLKSIETRNILEDLGQTKFTGSSKPALSYSDIATKNNVSPSKVARIAKENGISRKSNNNNVSQFK